MKNKFLLVCFILSMVFWNSFSSIAQNEPLKKPSKLFLGVTLPCVATARWGFSKGESMGYLAYERTYSRSYLLGGLDFVYSLNRFLEINSGANFIKDESENSYSSNLYGYVNSVAFQNNYIEVPVNVILFLAGGKNKSGGVYFSLGENFEFLCYEQLRGYEYLTYDPRTNPYFDPPSPKRIDIARPCFLLSRMCTTFGFGSQNTSKSGHIYIRYGFEVVGDGESISFWSRSPEWYSNIKFYPVKMHVGYRF